MVRRRRSSSSNSSTISNQRSIVRVVSQKTWSFRQEMKELEESKNAELTLATENIQKMDAKLREKDRELARREVELAQNDIRLAENEEELDRLLNWESDTIKHLEEEQEQMIHDQRNSEVYVERLQDRIRDLEKQLDHLRLGAPELDAAVDPSQMLGNDHSRPDSTESSGVLHPRNDNPVSLSLTTSSDTHSTTNIGPGDVTLVVGIDQSASTTLSGKTNLDQGSKLLTGAEHTHSPRDLSA
ncbi:hypothetical protein F5878DRAFT_667799 [Lentinula raphanica]|uniref:Uncharacterized protein n=1 Tax=Lentinula raphanica TaxID=153919 RepID=A0AA38U2I7_9AGAR|nr:hypothetical protein F5878DRAFT_667799 [Lentinula raphanica]